MDSSQAQPISRWRIIHRRNWLPRRKVTSAIATAISGTHSIFVAKAKASVSQPLKMTEFFSVQRQLHRCAHALMVLVASLAVTT